MAALVPVLEGTAPQPDHGRPRRSLLGPSLLLLAGAAVFSTVLLPRAFTGGVPLDTWCNGGGLAAGTYTAASAGTPRGDHVALHANRQTVKARMKYQGTTRKMYMERLRHRRWASQSKYPRIFGYVEKWNDLAGEGLIMDQEKQQMYLVIRDEIGRCYHNHKTLQRAEFVEFFATDEMDEVAGLPLARNVSGPFGAYVKGAEEYRSKMLASGTFPKRWQDTPDQYYKKVGEWWLCKKYRNGYSAK